MMKNSFSGYALLCCYAVMLFFGLQYYPKWTKSGSEATISWDVQGYYTYLPAFLIYKDYHQCHFRDSLNNIYQSSPDYQHLFPQPNGGSVIKYPAGQALLMSPFFAIAHTYNKVSKKYPADGYSYPYQLAIGLGYLFYAFIGLFLFRIILLKYFSDVVAGITILCIGIGSNYLNYASVDQCMSHNPLFTLYSVLILMVIRYYQKPNISKAFGIGLITGLMTLIRPTEILSLLIVLLWGINNWKQLKDRIVFAWQQWQHIIVMIIGFSIFISIQLAYWKTVSGHFVVYSYNDQGFNWLHPYFEGFLTSVRCGWLRYTPIMLLTLLGFVPFIFNKQNMWSVVAFSFINLYIICCWDIWWFGGRAMVQSYVVMSFALAALIEWCWSKRIFKYILVVLLISTAYINIWWTINAHGGKVAIMDVSKAYSKKTYGQWYVDDNINKLQDNADWFEANPNNIDTLLNTTCYLPIDTNKKIIDGKTYCLLNNTIQFSSEIQVPTTDKKWIRTFVACKINQKEWNYWSMTQLIIRFYYQDKEVKSNMIRVQRILNDNETKTISFDAKTPSEKFDKIVFSAWNANGEKEIFLGNLKIIAFND